MPSKLKLNTSQLLALRHADPETRMLRCDGSTGKALVNRGLAVWDIAAQCYFITPEGLERRKFKADVKGNSTFEGAGGCNDPSLMEDLPATS